MKIKTVLSLMESLGSSSEKSFIDLSIQVMQRIGEITRTFENNDIPQEDRVKYYKRMLSRWFAMNYSNVKSYARELQGRGSAVRAIADIPVFAQRYESSPFTKGDGMAEYLKNIPMALEQLRQPELASRFRAAFDRMDDMARIGKQQKPEPTQRQREESDKLKSQQYSAVENIINQQLAQLDPATRHKAREFIARSANKLQALQQFLNK